MNQCPIKYHEFCCGKCLLLFRTSMNLASECCLFTPLSFVMFPTNLMLILMGQSSKFSVSFRRIIKKSDLEFICLCRETIKIYACKMHNLASHGYRTQDVTSLGNWRGCVQRMAKYMEDDQVLIYRGDCSL